MASLGADEEPDGVGGVMGDAEGLDLDIADGEGGPGGEDAEVEGFPLELQLDGLLGQPVAVDGDVQPGRQHGEALDVIGMLVGDQNPAQVFRGPSDPQQSLPNLPGAEARVDEQPRVGGLQMRTVAAGTAAENGRHAARLGSAPGPDKRESVVHRTLKQPRTGPAGRESRIRSAFVLSST
jgi:hypothetical protein